MLPQEEACPINDDLLGELYRAAPEGLPTLIESVSPQSRAMLAVYCGRRAHLATLGLAVASTCEKHDLIAAAGAFGAMMFEQSRLAPSAPVGVKRRGVTLSNATMMQRIIAQDLI